MTGSPEIAGLVPRVSVAVRGPSAPAAGRNFTAKVSPLSFGMVIGRVAGKAPGTIWKSALFVPPNVNEVS